MKKITLALALLASLGLAQAASHEHEMTHDMSRHAPQTILHTGTGVVKAINAKTGKVQIAHDPIASLSWPSMTMWFAVKDMPHDLQVGDHVNFGLMQGDKRQWMIVDIRRK